VIFIESPDPADGSRTAFRLVGPGRPMVAGVVAVAVGGVLQSALTYSFDGVNTITFVTAPTDAVAAIASE
jgi:hypothetical protein